MTAKVFEFAVRARQLREERLLGRLRSEAMHIELGQLAANASSLHDVWQRASRSDSMLILLKLASEHRLVGIDKCALRRFACECARRAQVCEPDAHDLRALEVAEQLAERQAVQEEVAALRASLAARSVGPGVCGMPRCAPSAAAFFAIRHLLDEDVVDAAIRAAHYAGLTAAYRAAEQHAESMKWPPGEAWEESWRIKEVVNSYPSLVANAEGVERAAQARLLREMVEDPFGGSQPPQRAERREEFLQ